MHVHRRKSSKEEDEDTVIGLNDDVQSNRSEEVPELPNGLNGVNDSPSRRIRVNSTPLHPQKSLNRQPPPPLPPSAGPHRTSFTFPRAPNGVNGHIPPSPLRPSFAGHAHVRNHSVSSTFPASPSSPLSSSFSAETVRSPNTQSFRVPSSGSAPEMNGAAVNSNGNNKQESRRHSRIHSRNLSVFFPRPGAMPTPTIAEDGSQEIEIPHEEPPVKDIPPAERTPLGAGFKFGGQPPSSASATYSSYPPLPTPMSAKSSASRRGHHHKHSLSHNFFSFLEPGAPTPTSASADDMLRTASLPNPPATPWNTTTRMTAANGHHEPVLHSSKPTAQITASSTVAAVGQFVLGAWLWVAGQQRGSLSCTGLGYWVVFDAFGVGVAQLLPGWLAKTDMQNKFRRPYGNARVETLSMFAQAVYLMFASVYICKETVEHVLLSAGDGEEEGHHHHHTEGFIDFPLLPLFLCLLTIVITAASFENHSKLVDTTDNRIPSLRTLIRSVLSPSPTSSASSRPSLPPTTLSAAMLTNPYIISPLVFSLSILLVVFFASPSQHQALDLMLAGVMTAVTFKVSYHASVVLGTVLLQTSPPRGQSDGRMELFLRAMREIERHPQIMHLPAPHIWQLTPFSSSGSGGLVVTMELHVRDDMGDDDVLRLTRWVWEKCEGALKGGGGGVRGKKGEWEEDGEREGAEITIGIVRG